MFKSFKSYFNKNDFKYSNGNVDPFEFHKTFYNYMVKFKVADVEDKYKYTYFNQNLFLFIIAFIASLISFVSLSKGVYHSDIPNITEAGTYCLILFYELIMLVSTRINLPQYHYLLKTLTEDFRYICSEGSKYRDRYFENQLITWKLCITTIYFTFSIPIGMVGFAITVLIVFLWTHKPGEEGNRPLLFPFSWPGVDFYTSPAYEIAFIFSSVAAFLYAYNYIFMLQTQIVWIRQITSKVDIVTWSLEDLLVDVRPASTIDQKLYVRALLQKRLREIIIQHQSMYSLLENYAMVYKKFLLSEQTICRPIICLTAYCSAQKLDEGEFNAILIILCTGTLVMYFIPSYLCTFVAFKVRSVCDTCWSIPFWNADPVIRPYMVLMMQRSLRRLPLHASGFEEVTIETFSKKVTSAYSLFNMLRQVNI